MKVSSQPECWNRSASVFPMMAMWSPDFSSSFSTELLRGESAAEPFAGRSAQPSRHDNKKRFIAFIHSIGSTNATAITKCVRPRAHCLAIVLGRSFRLRCSVILFPVEGTSRNAAKEDKARDKWGRTRLSFVSARQARRKIPDQGITDR